MSIDIEIVYLIVKETTFSSLGSGLWGKPAGKM